MKILSAVFVAVAAMFFVSAVAAIAEPVSSGTATDESQIRNLLDAQAADWNRGDIENFVNGYWKSEETLFVGAGGVKRGWQQILDRYRHDYPDRKAMGHLAFSNLEVHVTCADSAYAIGVFELQRATPAGKSEEHAEPSSSSSSSKPDQKEVISGYFTLYLRKFGTQWQIVADHTTRAQSVRE